MPFSRDHHQFHAVPTGGGAPSFYPSYTWKHYYPYSVTGDDNLGPSAKRRKLAATSDGRSWPLNMETGGRSFVMSQLPLLHCNSTGPGVVPFQRQSEKVDMPVMSRDEIDRCSPSRKDGIDRYMETRLRYSYCAYLQSLGMRLDLPQMTVGTAMVLCHRFFLRRSHASSERIPDKS